MRFYVEKITDAAGELKIDLKKGKRFPEDRIAAIKLAVKKWEVVHKYHRENVDVRPLSGIGYKTCALCHLYRKPENSDACRGCPIKNVTGEDYCIATPLDSYDQWDGEFSLEDAALAELNFLKGLLDKEAK